jgi:hypothetical protein
MTQTDKIIAAAREYRKFGWNVIPLYNYSKNPASSNFIRKRGWKEYQEKSLTDSEFTAAFGERNLTGVGLITGALSRTVVIDEDSYKEGGKKVELHSPMISLTASGGRHIFGKYLSPVRSMGWREDVNVEGKGDGGFIVLPPSQVYRKDSDGKQTEEIGDYKWLTRCTWEELPVISEKELLPFRSANAGQMVDLHDFAHSSVGSRHPNLVRVANSLFNRFKPNEWDIAERQIYLLNQSHPDPKPDREVADIIRDAKAFVTNNPKTSYLPPKQVAEATPEIDYSKMNDEQIEEVEHREVITTGLRRIDEILPFIAGFYVVVGNPGAGKGWLATWLAKQFFILHQKRTVLFTLEMAEPLIRARILQQWSGLTLEQFENGGNTNQAKNLMRQRALTVYPFGQNDTAYQTPENFAADIDRFYEEGYRVFMFDHFHELDGANADIATNQKVTQLWGRVYQEVCKKYPDIWLIVFGQPNGAAAKKVFIERTDISGGKGMTQKCEVFLSLNRIPLPMDKGFDINAQKEQDPAVILWIDKNRLSPQQKVGCQVFLSPTGNFVGNPLEDVLPDEAWIPPVTNPQISLLEETPEEESGAN